MTKLIKNATVFDHSFNNPVVRKKLLDRIDSINEYRGVRVVFYDGKKIHELRPHPPICAANRRTVVIRPLSKQEKEVVTHGTLSKQDDDRFYSELLSSGLSCGAAVLSWVVVGGSSAAIPVSGGTSTAITVLAYSAATASSLQCANSGYRLFNESDLGDNSVNAWLDSQDWYVHTTTALDIISVVGGVSSAGATLKTVINLRKAGTPMKEVLKGLSRQERKRLTEEIIRAHNPGISNKVLKALVAAGKYPKRYSKLEVSSSVRLQLKDAIAATLSFSGSATGGIVRNPERIMDFIVGIYNEIETY
jgi:hypothetical protein